MRTARSSLVVLTVLIFAPESLSRPADSTPWLPEGKPETVATVRSGQAWLVYVAHADYAPRKDPRNDKDLLPYFKEGKELSKVPFLEPLHVAKSKRTTGSNAYANRQVGGREWHLLVRYGGGKITSVVGWFDTRFLLNIEANIDRATHIHNKVFLVTRPLAVEKTHEVPQEVPYYDVPYPDNTTKERGKIRLLQIYFVFADVGTPKDGYVCVGREEIINRGSPAETIVGWIPKVYTIPWNTRFAFDWHAASTQPGASPTRKPLGMVFRNRRHAYTAMGYPSAKETKPPAGEAKPRPLQTEYREPGQPYPGMSRFEIRYPILSYEGRGDDSDEVISYPEFVARDETTAKYKNRLHRVAVYSGFRDKVTGKPVAGLDQKKLAELRAQLEIVRTEMTTTEVLFVIDKTQSMEDAGEVVAKTFREVLGVLHKTGRKVRIAMTYYRDVATLKDDPDKEVDSTPLEDFDSKRVERIASELLDRKSYKDGGDPPELVFYGLKKGIETADFSTNSRKLVVLIGDCGNKKEELLGPKKNPTVADIVAALHTQGPKPLKGAKPMAPPSPITFFAIHVRDPNEPGTLGDDVRAALKAFKTEGEEIVAQSQKRLDAMRPKGRSAGRYISAFRPAELRKAILDCFAELEAQRTVLEKAIRKVQEEGVVPRSLAGEELEQILQGRIGDQLELLAKVQGAQLSEVGFAWERNGDGVPQMASCLLANQNEVTEVVRILQMLPKLHGYRGDPDKLVGELVLMGGGEYQADRVMNVSLDELTLKRQGLVFISPLLRQPVAKMLAAPDWDDQLQVFREKATRLEDMLFNRYRKWSSRLTSSDKLPEPLPLDGEKDNPPPRFFFLGGERTKWFWTDLEKEWP